MYHQPLIVDGTVYTYRVNEPGRDHTPVEDGKLEFIAIDAETGDPETVFVTDDVGPDADETGDTTDSDIEFDIDLDIDSDDIVFEDTTESVMINDIIIHNGSVYFGTSNRIHAHDVETGEQHWSTTPEPGMMPTGMRVVDDVLVVADNANLRHARTGEQTPDLCAIDIETGESLWSRTSAAEASNSPQLPVIADGLVQHPDTAPVRDLRSGEELATLPARETPSLHDGELYGMIRRDGKRRLVSHSWETGEKRWEYAPEGDTPGNEPVGVYGTPVAVGDTVVVREIGERDDLFIGIDREMGTRQWSVDTTSYSDSEDIHPHSEFWVADGETVYCIHDGGAATAIDPTDGTIEWQVIPDGWQLSKGCALAEDLLVTVGTGGTLYGIS